MTSRCRGAVGVAALFLATHQKSSLTITVIRNAKTDDPTEWARTYCMAYVSWTFISDSQHLVAARRSREVVSVRLDLHDGSCLQTTVTVINTSKMNTVNDLPRLVFQPTECNFDTTYIAYVQVTISREIVRAEWLQSLSSSKTDSRCIKMMISFNDTINERSKSMYTSFCES